MGTYPKKINQHYFDRRRRTTEEKIAMYYVLGAWYGSGLPLESKKRKKDGSWYIYNGILFRSRTKKLVKIVHDELESDHAIYSDRSPRKPPYTKLRNSYWFQSLGVPTLCDRLEELGALAPKEERDFPEIPKKYLSHFVRGYSDARAGIYQSKNKTQISIGGSPQFIAGLKNVLETYAHVEGGGTRKNILQYHTADAARICDFIYQEEGLYLPFKKRRLERACAQLQRIKKGRENVENRRQQKIERRLGKAKKVLEQGGTINEASSAGCYSHQSQLYRDFKEVMDMTPTQYRNQCVRHGRK